MLTRAQKQKIIEELKGKIFKQKAMIFVDFTNLKVKDFSDLRKKLKEAGDEIKVAKKTLMEVAFKEAKIDFKPKKISGEIALVFGYKDEIVLARTIWQFAEANPNLKILGGFLENKFKEADEIIELAKISSKEELFTQLVRSISAPIVNFINVLTTDLRNFIYILSQIKVNK